MSDEDDPFEDLEKVAEDREGDPFEHLQDADEEDDDQYDGHDVTPAGHRDELEEENSQQRSEGGPAEVGAGAEGFPDSDFEVPEEPDVRRGDEATASTDPFEGSSKEPADPFDGSSEEPADPFGEPHGPDEDPFEEGGVFEEMEVDDLDPDEVWAQLTDAEERGSVSELQERIYAEVSKHRYCEQCEFFSQPPDVHCSHEGTEILEFTDMEEVRVVDCPVVAERKELEEE